MSEQSSDVGNIPGQCNHNAVAFVEHLGERVGLTK